METTSSTVTGSPNAAVLASSFISFTTAACCSSDKSNSASTRSPSTNAVASRRTLCDSYVLQSTCEKPPTPRTTVRMDFSRRRSSRNWALVSRSTAPMEPSTQPYRRAGLTPLAGMPGTGSSPASRGALAWSPFPAPAPAPAPAPFDSSMPPRSSAASAAALAPASPLAPPAALPLPPLPLPLPLPLPAASASSGCVTSAPGTNRFTMAPRWNSPDMSSRDRSSSVVASRLRTHDTRLPSASALTNVSSPIMATAVVQAMR
mmetsp:Transcript_17014/g.54582  ORF Transcript_17014/g.54582 Transcript_17014/m.54582 type:complete len:261 (+) Transcript_17014:92-874(+)